MYDTLSFLARWTVWDTSGHQTEIQKCAHVGCANQNGGVFVCLGRQLLRIDFVKNVDNSCWETVFVNLVEFFFSSARLKLLLPHSLYRPHRKYSVEAALGVE